MTLAANVDELRRFNYSSICSHPLPFQADETFLSMSQGKAESDEEDIDGLLDAVAEIEEEWFLSRALSNFERQADEERRRRQKLGLECFYCGTATKCVLGAELNLPGKWAMKTFFACPHSACDAYVGCYSNGRALGSTANAQLRCARKIAHSAFDPIWESAGAKMSRDEAYCWLSTALNLPKDETHMGMFTLDQCRQVVEKTRTL